MNFAEAANLKTDFLEQSNGLAAVFIHRGADAGLLPILQLTADCVAESFSGIRIFKADEVIDGHLVGDFFSVLGKRETVPCLVLFHGRKFTLLPLATVSLPTCKRMVEALHLAFSVFAYPLIRLALLFRGFSRKSAGEVRGRYIRALTVWA